MPTICFFGTARVAAQILIFLVEQQFTILQVISQPDQKSSRGMLLQSPAVVKTAKKFSINLSQPQNITDKTFYNYLKKLGADFFVVVDYGKILPQAILDLPKQAAINLHFSLLPKWRGASPVRSSIANGDRHSGISIIKMIKKLDTGDILRQQKIKVNPAWNHLALSKKLIELGCQGLQKVLINFSKIKPLAQNEALATYSRKFSKSDGFLDWSQPAKVIFRLYQSLAPEIKLFSYYCAKKVFLIEIELAEKLNIYQDVGKILRKNEHKIEIATSKGSIYVTKVQLENKAIISAKDWFNGYQVKIGSIFNNFQSI